HYHTTHLATHPHPTLRSSDHPAPSSTSLDTPAWDLTAVAHALGTPGEPYRDPVHGDGVAFRLGAVQPVHLALFPGAGVVRVSRGDRKSTRLNFSHVAISYAVF